MWSPLCNCPVCLFLNPAPVGAILYRVDVIPVVQPTGLRYPIRQILFSGINVSKKTVKHAKCIYTPKQRPTAVVK